MEGNSPWLITFLCNIPNQFSIWFIQEQCLGVYKKRILCDSISKNSDKVYTYYRLVHSYKIGNKIRHRTVISLGSLSGIPKEKHKELADRIEELITGNSNQLFVDNEKYKAIETVAQKFADKIIKNKLFSTNTKKSVIEKEIKNNYQEVDLETIEQIESKEIGGEWLIKQAFDKLGIDKILSETGLSANQAEIAQMLLTAKLLHPSSELETERWLSENSAAPELYKTDENISRYKLYLNWAIANKENYQCFGAKRFS